MLKKILTRLIVLLLVFVVGVVVFSHFRNREDTVEAVELEAAILPVLYMQEGDLLINPMFGNKAQMDGTTMRDHLTLLSTSRDLKLAVDTKGETITDVVYTVKNTSGTEIVENSTIKSFTEEDGYQKADIHLDTPILMNQEYILEFEVNLEDGTKAYYYTRLIQRSGVSLTDYLNFANMFYQTCMDPEAAQELASYMETNSSNSNTSFQNVDIHSSLEQITWGNLNAQLMQTGMPEVKEINETTASISVDYMISSQDDDGNVEYYTVTDFYRMRKSSDRIVLLNFERCATQVFDAELPVLTSTGINLGVVPGDTQYMANTAGDIVAFVVNGDLWSYNRSANKCTKVFSFRKKGEYELDERYNYGEHDIQIVRVSESGDITFVVYGYMNRGKHEGETGVAVYNFQAESQVAQETLFLPATVSYPVLRQSLDVLSYVSTDGLMYFYLNGSLYQMNLSDGTYQVLQEGIASDCFVVSEDQANVAWMAAANASEATEITVMSLETQQTLSVTAQDGQKVRALGFINDDFVYGIANDSDIVTDISGNQTFAMNTIRIQGSDGTIKKEYHQDGVYVTGISISNGLLEMDRVIRQGDAYVETTQDHIMNGEQQADEVVTSRMATIGDRREQQMVLEFQEDGQTANLLSTEARFSENDSSASLTISYETGDEPVYFVYAKGELQSIMNDPAQAILEADDQVGVVLNQDQVYVWERGNRPTSAQIDPASLPEAFRNASLDEAALQASLGEGETLLNLTGCSLDSVLYLVAQGHPVVARLNANGMENVVIVGYDQFNNTLLYDPTTQQTVPMGQQDSTNAFAAQGNLFLSYM